MAVKFATINLFHFAEPGIYWHERKSNKVHTPPSWAAKKDWLSQTLTAMDADVVAFQEVVSVEELKQLCLALGYTDFVCLTEPKFDEAEAAGVADGTKIYVNATVALVSRFPVSEAEAISSLGDVIAHTVIDNGAGFSRPPIRCHIAVPDIGDTVVYAAHFKSQGAFVDEDRMDAIADWEEKFKTYFLERMYEGVDQVSKRAAEAGAVYARFRQDIEADLERPVILLGDLNEGPDSHTISILTQGDMVFAIGSIPRAHFPDEHRFRQYTHILYDCYALVPNQQVKRPVTHSGWGSGETLDYAIVSNGLNPKNPRRKGTVVKHEVWSDHFIAGMPKDITSDHAPVVVTVDPVA